MQLNQLRASMRQALVDYNVLGLSGGGSNYSMMSSGARLNQFAGWLENAASASLDVRWWAHPWLDKATQHGLNSGREELQGVEYQPIPTTFADLHELARHELRGIIAVLVQKVVRQAHSASARRLAPHQAFREMSHTVNGDIRNRLQLFAHHFAQKGHIHGKGEYFKQAGVRRFGIVPEMRIPRRKNLIKGQVLGDDGRRTFDAEPADTTWVTADDDLVCNACEEMAMGSPYSLDEVMDLMPLHPGCRCDLTTFDGPEEEDFGDSLRDAYDPDEERDEYGRWTTGGFSAPGGDPVVAANLAEIERLNPGALARARSSTSTFEHIEINVPGQEFVAYHGTTEEVVESIRKTGLKSHASPAADVWAAKQNIQVGQLFMAGDRAKSVYMATDLNYAYSFAKIAANVRHQHPTMLEIHIPAAEAKGHLFIDEQADKNTRYIARFVGDIKPEWIKREVSSTGYNKESASLDKQPDVVIYATVFDALPEELGKKRKDAAPDFTQDPSSGRFTGSVGHGGSKPIGKKKTAPEDFEKAQIRLGFTSDKFRTKKFVDDWDDKVGETPAEFKQSFLGHTAASMGIRIPYEGTWEISGALFDKEGDRVGTYTRDIDWNNKTAESSFLSLTRSATGHSLGKTILASNIAAYKKMGIERVKVHANIDVGGYAWAKYGYVPTQSSWNDLRGIILNKLGAYGSSRSATQQGWLSHEKFEPTSWEQINDDDQTRIKEAWLRSTESEFFNSEVEGWRDNGEGLHQAKVDLARNFDEDADWAEDVVKSWRTANHDVPYSTDQIMKSIKVKYDDQNYDGRADPEIEFDDDKLREPSDAPPREQLLLPGFKEVDPASHFTEHMRDELGKQLVDAFNSKADDEQYRVEPPDYLRESSSESQHQYWDDMEDRERYRWANRNNELPQYPLPDEESREEPGQQDPKQIEMKVDPAPKVDDLVQLASSENPKAIWAIADSKRGKELLLNSDWTGYLNFRDKESMDRFNAYVSKVKKAA